MASVNLWEAMLDSAAVHPFKKKDISYAVQDLDKVAYFSGQEVTLEATDAGWLFKIFSCFDREQEIWILFDRWKGLVIVERHDQKGREDING